MESCDSAEDSQGAFPPPDVPPLGESVDVVEGEASFPLHLVDTCPPPLPPRLPQLQRAFPPELAGVVVAAVEVGELAEPECTAPDVYAAFAGVDVHPSSCPPWWGDIRFPPQLLPSLRGPSAFHTSRIGSVAPTMCLHCIPVSFHCTDLGRKKSDIGQFKFHMIKSL